MSYYWAYCQLVFRKKPNKTYSIGEESNTGNGACLDMESVEGSIVDLF